LDALFKIGEWGKIEVEGRRGRIREGETVVYYVHINKKAQLKELGFFCFLFGVVLRTDGPAEGLGEGDKVGEIDGAVVVDIIKGVVAAKSLGEADEVGEVDCATVVKVCTIVCINNDGIARDVNCCGGVIEVVAGEREDA